MTWQQLFQLIITMLFVAVLIELLIALTLFHIRMFREDRQRRKAKRREGQRLKKEEDKLDGTITGS